MDITGSVRSSPSELPWLRLLGLRRAWGSRALSNKRTVSCAGTGALASDVGAGAWGEKVAFAVRTRRMRLVLTDVRCKYIGDEAPEVMTGLNGRPFL